MNTVKTKHHREVRQSRIREIQQRLGEREDRLHTEHVHNWIRELAAERQKFPKTPNELENVSVQ